MASTWDTTIPRDLLLPGLADIEGKYPSICLDMTFSADRESLEVSFWPNEACCLRGEAPQKIVIATRQDWETGVAESQFGPRMVAAAEKYLACIKGE